MKRKSVSYLLVFIMLFSIPVCCWAYNGKEKQDKSLTDYKEKSNVEGKKYIDKDSGTEFTISSGWHEDPFNTDPGYYDYKFKSDDEVALILYGSNDVWRELPLSERLGHTRETYDISMLKDDDLKAIAAVLGGSDSSFRHETIAGQEYVELDSVVSFGVLKTTIHNYVTVHNGFMYFFEFSSDDADTHFDDFMSMLNSVHYPDIANQLVSSTEDSSEIKLFDDSVSGLTFEIPLGWSQGNTEIVDDAYNTRFIADDELGILDFKRYDLWEAVPKENRTYIHRSDLNNDYWRRVVLDGIEDDKIIKAYYNGVEYFWMDNTNMDFEVDSGIDVVRATRVDNGFYVEFQYVGASESTHLQEFKELLKKVNYPES